MMIRSLGFTGRLMNWISSRSQACINILSVWSPSYGSRSGAAELWSAEGGGAHRAGPARHPLEAWRCGERSSTFWGGEGGGGDCGLQFVSFLPLHILVGVPLCCPRVCVLVEAPSCRSANTSVHCCRNGPRKSTAPRWQRWAPAPRHALVRLETESGWIEQQCSSVTGVNVEILENSSDFLARGSICFT